MSNNNENNENNAVEKEWIIEAEDRNTDYGDYEASNIDILKGVNAVRKRPGMYIGDTDKEGLHHLIFEIGDNSVDEALAGFCDTIIIEKHPNNIISISDNGRGIPTGIHPIHGISAATIIFTELHAGGKFGGEGSGYKVSGGLHGVGATVTNALSDFLEVRIKRNGSLHYQRFEKGVPVEDLKIIEKLKDPKETGTTITFKPDQTMFPEAMEDDGNVNLSLDHIRDRLKRTAYLTPKLRFITIEEDGSKIEYYSENGIIDYVAELAPTLYKETPKFDKNKNEEMLSSEIKFFKDSDTYINTFDNTKFNAEVEIAFVFQNKYFGTNILSFANNIHTSEGGKHVIGFEKAFLKFINDYNVKHLKKQEIFLKEDILEGLNAVISFKTEEPKFSNQTKQKLSTGAAQTLCYKATKEFLENEFETDPDFALFLIAKANSAKEMREQIDKKRNEVQKNVNTVGLGGTAKKLTDCNIKTQEGTELFLVEGDSAGGSARQGRDRMFQAILPLKGKILNSLKKSSSDVENSEEVKNLRLALKTGTDEDFDIKKLRYGKIIIMCDADVDGAHIETLILTYFMVKMPELIRNGHVYLAKPPLYVVKNNKGGAKIKNFYVQDDEELEKFYVNGKLPSNLSKQRFKGLGEMNPGQLSETTMDPKTRTLIRVTLDENDVEGTYQIFQDLMGSKVEPRRDFIFENAINVDIDA